MSAAIRTSRWHVMPLLALLASSVLGTGVALAAATVAPAETGKKGAGDAAPRFDQKTTDAQHPGEPFFTQYCASCHLGQVAKAPH